METLPKQLCLLISIILQQSGEMNRIHPQNIEGASFGSTKSLFTANRGTIQGLQGCCKDCCACIPCTQQCICVSAIGLGILGVIATVIALVVTIGIPPHTPVNRLCVTSGNQTGFLCDNRESCIPASQVCDARQNCANGEDEQGTLCDDLPNNLPGYLIFYCSNRKVWVYADKKCNGINDCGDCSDEVGAWASCPPCGPQWWGCTMVVFHMYCSCIPRRLCRDGIQHCSDWSDEYICTR